jgi:nitroimidazol reductase NimA-like FMN-containing flavoprotein (pyridoxamine 5'-phosphate oxidase superfamily)
VRASRPRFSPRYGIAESDEGLLTWEWALERLTASRNYWISTTRADGRPHAMPVWGLWLEGAVWFSTHPESQKGRNLAGRPEVVAHLESGDDVAIVEGVAEPVRGGDLLARFIDDY